VEGATVSEEVFHSLYGRGTVINVCGLITLVKFDSLTSPIGVHSRELRPARPRRKLL
jgi:hypothetical protein